MNSSIIYRGKVLLDTRTRELPDVDLRRTCTGPPFRVLNAHFMNMQVWGYRAILLNGSHVFFPFISHCHVQKWIRMTHRLYHIQNPYHRYTAIFTFPAIRRKLVATSPWSRRGLAVFFVPLGCSFPVRWHMYTLFLHGTCPMRFTACLGLIDCF